MLSLNGVPVIKSAVVSRMVDNEMVIVLPSHGQVKVLNEVASQIWKLSDGNHTIQQIIDIICLEYDVDQAHARADALELIQSMIDKDMIELFDQPEI
jgi:hypothetical protein